MRALRCFSGGFPLETGCVGCPSPSLRGCPVGGTHGAVVKEKGMLTWAAACSLPQRILQDSMCVVLFWVASGAGASLPTVTHPCATLRCSRPHGTAAQGETALSLPNGSPPFSPLDRPPGRRGAPFTLPRRRCRGPQRRLSAVLPRQAPRRAGGPPRTPVRTRRRTRGVRPARPLLLPPAPGGPPGAPRGVAGPPPDSAPLPEARRRVDGVAGGAGGPSAAGCCCGCLGGAAAAPREVSEAGRGVGGGAHPRPIRARLLQLHERGVVEGLRRGPRAA